MRQEERAKYWDDNAYPIEGDIFNKPGGRKKLYMVVWERAANSGIYYVWAENEKAAFMAMGFNPELVQMTIVCINAENMPHCVGVVK